MKETMVKSEKKLELEVNVIIKYEEWPSVTLVWQESKDVEL